MSQLAKIKNQLSSLSIECEFWDVRIEEVSETAIELIDRDISTCSTTPSLGAFLRVRKNGFWFYQSTTQLDRLKEALEVLAKQKSLSQSSYPYLSKGSPPFQKILFEKNNFSTVDLAEKLALTQSYVHHVWQNTKVSATRSAYKDIYKVKSYLNSLGTEYEYDFNQAGIFCRYTLKEEQSLFEDKIQFYASHFEQLQNKTIEIDEALLKSEEFLSAPVLKPGKYKVLFDPEVTGVFTHESFGHKSEADFILGDPTALESWKLGTPVGVPQLSIVDDGQHMNTSGYCPIDDEGVRAQKNYLIKNGLLSGRLHTISTASQLHEVPTGNARAMNFEFEPIVRMTSTYIEPGEESLESLLKRSVGAVLVEGVKHGSGLSTFTIAPCRGYLIEEKGRRKPVRVSVISGSVFETLNNIEGISREFELHSSAIGGCGKMSQWPLPVADGGPYILVKDMQVS